MVAAVLAMVVSIASPWQDVPPQIDKSPLPFPWALFSGDRAMVVSVDGTMS